MACEPAAVKALYIRDEDSPAPLKGLIGKYADGSIYIGLAQMPDEQGEFIGEDLIWGDLTVNRGGAPLPWGSFTVARPEYAQQLVDAGAATADRFGTLTLNDGYLPDESDVDALNDAGWPYLEPGDRVLMSEAEDIIPCAEAAAEATDFDEPAQDAARTDSER